MTWLYLMTLTALFIVFGVSGCTKLARRQSLAAILDDIGIPRAAHSMISLSVPIVELLLAGAILVPFTRGAALLGITLALAAFTVLLIWLLVHGRRPPCNCFGNIDSKPINGGTVGRNVIIFSIAITALILWSRDTTLLPDRTDRSDIAVILSIISFSISLLNTFVLVGLLTRYGRISRILESGSDERYLLNGEFAPLFELPTLSGEAMSSIAIFEKADQTFLIFTEPRCTYCEQLFQELEIRLENQHIPRSQVVIIVSGNPGRVEERIGALGPLILVDEGAKTAETYSVPGTPSGLTVSETGIISGNVSLGPSSILSQLFP